MSNTSNNEGLVAQTKIIAFIFALAISIIGGGIFLAAIWNVFFTLPERGEILRLHFGAIIGMPVAGAFAFLLVVFLRQTEGPVEFKGAGFEFK